MDLLDVLKDRLPVGHLGEGAISCAGKGMSLSRLYHEYCKRETGQSYARPICIHTLRRGFIFAKSNGFFVLHVLTVMYQLKFL